MIAVDDRVLAAPKVMEPVPGDTVAITLGGGGDAAALARTLRAGSLPAPVTLRAESLVGPAAR
ncbi:MAG: hypothetical protein R3F59_30030 [Myxococcota bacterium]